MCSPISAERAGRCGPGDDRAGCARGPRRSSSGHGVPASGSVVRGPRAALARKDVDRAPQRLGDPPRGTGGRVLAWESGESSRTFLCPTKQLFISYSICLEWAPQPIPSLPDRRAVPRPASAAAHAMRSVGGSIHIKIGKLTRRFLEWFRSPPLVSMRGRRTAPESGGWQEDAQAGGRCGCGARGAAAAVDREGYKRAFDPTIAALLLPLLGAVSLALVSTARARCSTPRPGSAAAGVCLGSSRSAPWSPTRRRAPGP